nr:MAG TPA: hypothetical protein [Caudoviricetes sp.]
MRPLSRIGSVSSLSEKWEEVERKMLGGYKRGMLD